MAMTDSSVNTLIRGTSEELPEAIKREVEGSIRRLSKRLDGVRNNTTFANKFGSGDGTSKLPGRNTADTEMFTTISEMINGSRNDFAGFGDMFDNLCAKNKKYFTIIKDYEIMPILIPQINRVLSFLVNECLSPDIQHSQTFTITYTGQSSGDAIQKDIDRIKKDMKLDNLLRDIYWNRFKLGREYYIVEDYNQTFDHMLEMLKKKRINEDTAAMSDIQYIEGVYSSLIGRIDEVSISVPVDVIHQEDTGPRVFSSINEAAGSNIQIEQGQMDLSMTGLNIVIERSPIVQMIEDAQAELIHESYARYSSKRFFKDQERALNEAAILDTSKIEQIVDNMKKKKLQRCSIVRFDPARLFKLKIGGKVIGYFYVNDINESTANVINFSQALKDQLLKTRATNLANAQASAEDVIAKELATRIINTFDPNLGINRIEDIDLMHNFIRSNEIYKGNKRITFYYEDEIFDMSRADDSILTNAVFFTKLYSTLLLNNIVTKVLRGRGRQIHTVKIGVSPDIQRYIDNAMASLAMPEHNLGTLHGSFEQIMNPFNGASDIVIPTEEDSERYINTDYIPGQDVDMNDETLKMFLNNIVTSFNLDSAVLDATNGNLQFARTLTMESLQISNSVNNEQQDTYEPFSSLCLEVLRIMGSEETQAAVANGQVLVKFFEPKSLIIQNTIDDINNVKNLAEQLADIIPALNAEGSEHERNRLIYKFIKENSNFDFSGIEKLMEEVRIEAVDDATVDDIYSIIREYLEKTKQVRFGEENPDDAYLDDEENDETPETPPGVEDEDNALSPEEAEIAGMSDEDEEDEF